MFKQHLNGSLYISGLQLLNGNSMSYWSFERDNCTVTKLQKICLNPTPHPHLSSAIHPTSSLGLLKSLEEGFMFLFGFHTRWSQIKISSSIYILCFILLENYSVFLNFLKSLLLQHLQKYFLHVKDWQIKTFLNMFNTSSVDKHDQRFDVKVHRRQSSPSLFLYFLGQRGAMDHDQSLLSARFILRVSVCRGGPQGD